jgi:hypothetical protein
MKITTKNLWLRRSTPLVHGWWLSLLLLGSGCSLLRLPETQIRSPVGAYESATIRYQVDSPLARTAGRAASGNVQLASHEDADPTARSNADKVRTLYLKYPHPSGRTGYARAELIVESTRIVAGKTDAAPKPSGWVQRLRTAAREQLPGVTFADGVEAAWALDVPIAEVDKVIHALDKQNYFGDSNATATGVILSANVNGLTREKGWSRVPELESLVARVSREGSLVSQPRPLEQPRVPPRIASCALTRLPPVEAIAR